MPAKKKILAVDDDATALGALRQILAQKGYDVSTAPNGHDALDMLAAAAFDLVILDVSMPGMSGYDVCRQIRQQPKTQDLPSSSSPPKACWWTWRRARTRAATSISSSPCWPRSC